MRRLDMYMYVIDCWKNDRKRVETTDIKAKEHTGQTNRLINIGHKHIKTSSSSVVKQRKRRKRKKARYNRDRWRERRM